MPKEEDLLYSGIFSYLGFAWIWGASSLGYITQTDWEFIYTFAMITDDNQFTITHRKLEKCLLLDILDLLPLPL